MVQITALCNNNFHFGELRMVKHLLSMCLLCAFVGQVFAQTSQTPADDYNTIFKPLKWRLIGPFRGGRSVAGTGVVGDPKTYYM